MRINREGCSLIKVCSKTLLFNTKFVGSLLLLFLFLFFCFCFFCCFFCYFFVVFVHCHPLHIYNRKKCYCFPSPFSQKFSRSVHHGKYDFVFRFIFSSRLLVTVDPLDVLSFSYKLLNLRWFAYLSWGSVSCCLYDKVCACVRLSLCVFLCPCQFVCVFNYLCIFVTARACVFVCVCVWWWWWWWWWL